MCHAHKPKVTKNNNKKVKNRKEIRIYTIRTISYYI